MKTFKSVVAILVIVIAISSCKKSEKETLITPPVNNPTLTKIGETYILGAQAKAVIYALEDFKTGYNVIYTALFDSIDGSPLLDGHYDITPMMNSGMMNHSSPVENTEDVTATNGYFKSAVVFSMPGTASEWSLNILFHNHKNMLEGEGTIGVNVMVSNPAKFISTVVVADSNAKVYISLISPKTPQVGINDLEMVLHKKVDMMTFPSIDDYTIEIVPEMPSMGHGSPNNVNPVFTNTGHYVGKVNFTMTGLWYVHLSLYKNGILISNDQKFEITL